MLIDRLVNRLSECLQASSTADFIESCLLDSLPASPWALWTLCSLTKHRQRQNFVLDVVRDRLSGNPTDIANAGSFGHPPIARSGLVPGLTDWEYYFHGRGCCLTNRITGESIDVDFFDDTADWFDDFFYINYLQSLNEPELWERRLIELHRSFETVVLSCDELLEAGVLAKHHESKVVRLNFDTSQLNRVLEQLEENAQSEDMLVRVAAALNDWGGVLRVLPPGETTNQCIAASADSFGERESRLCQMFHADEHNGLPLLALAEIKSPFLRGLLHQALKQPPSGVVSTALDTLLKSEDASWRGEVAALQNRISPDGDLPQPHIWLKCLEYQLRFGSEKLAVSTSFKQASGLILAETAVLALEHSAENALRLFRLQNRWRVIVRRNSICMRFILRSASKTKYTQRGRSRAI